MDDDSELCERCGEYEIEKGGLCSICRMEEVTDLYEDERKDEY